MLVPNLQLNVVNKLFECVPVFVASRERKIDKLLIEF